MLMVMVMVMTEVVVLVVVMVLKKVRKCAHAVSGRTQKMEIARIFGRLGASWRRLGGVLGLT